MSKWFNNFLSAPFTEDEITHALFEMNPHGAPSSDEFLAHFFQKHWSLLKQDVCCYVLDFLNKQGSLENGNATFITLIGWKLSSIKLYLLPKVFLSPAI